MTPQTILITGATSGIGRHAALHLAKQGHRVIATGRRAHALEELRAEADGLELHTLRLDVTDAASIEQSVADVDELTQGYGVDVLVNNAGYGQTGAVLDVSLDRLRAQYETNVFGVVEVTRAFVPAMIRRGAGKVINVTSIGGRTTFPLLGVYTSSKYAVESLSDALRGELAPFGVRVVLVEPGAIRTGFNDTASSSFDAETVSSPWSPVYAHADELFAAFESVAPDPTPVSRTLASIVRSRRPSARYVTPWRNTFAVWMMTLAPAWLADAIIGRLVGLTRQLPTMSKAVQA